MKSMIKGLLISIIVIALDQWSKFYVFGLLEGVENNAISVMPSFNLVKVYNYGVSFGMFNELAYGRLILSLIAIVVTIILCCWLYKVKKFYMVAALGLIIGGAIGNIIDRLRLGAVADFLDFYIGDYHWPAFNIADAAVCIGVFILLIDSFISKEKKEKNDA